jgi:hypothetical protein
MTTGNYRFAQYMRDEGDIRDMYYQLDSRSFRSVISSLMIGTHKIQMSPNVQSKLFFFNCFGLPQQKQWKVEQVEQHASNVLRLKLGFSGCDMRQHTHNTLVTVSVAKEHFGAFWSVFGHRFVVLFFHLDFVSPNF